MEPTPIPPKVLNIDRLGDQFVIAVQVGRGKYNNITARSIDSLSEKISRNSVRISTVGLIFPIIKIPASKLDSHSRSGCNS
jgi:hypothetical protein